MLSQHLLENPLLEEVGSDMEEGEGSIERKEDSAAEGDNEGDVEPGEFSCLLYTSDAADE